MGLIYAPHALPMFREDKARTTAKQVPTARKRVFTPEMLSLFAPPTAPGHAVTLRHHRQAGAHSMLRFQQGRARRRWKGRR